MDPVTAVSERLASALDGARSLVDGVSAGRAGRELLLPVLGAIGFCSRIPLGTSNAAWLAFARRPVAIVVAAYPLGAALALALVPAVAPALVPAMAPALVPAVPGALPAIPALPPATVAFLLPAWLLALTGIAHLDGLADAADAAVVHGDAARRREILEDPAIGVGGLAAGGLALAGVALAGLGLAELLADATGASASTTAAAARTASAPTALAAAGAVVLAAEVGAKLGVLLLATVGPRPFGTMGGQFAGAGAPTALAGATLALPAVGAPLLALGETTGLAAALAVLGGPLAAVGVGAWGRARLDGVNGDCFGATNELGRVVGLHAGLVVLSASQLPGPSEPLAQLAGVVA